MKILLVGLTLSLTLSTAQAQLATASGANVPTVHRESLLIGKGDLLHVQFYDTPELEQRPRVDDAGAAPMLFLGAVPLAGKTPEEASQLVASLMVQGHYMSHPQVTVTVDQFATQEVSVSGEVVRPGAYPITTPRSVLDVLGLAGGLTPMADRRIVIEHRSGVKSEVPFLVSNDPVQALGEDVEVFPGDLVLVPRAGIVYILGDVGRPGGYPLVTNDAQMTLLQALATASSLNKTAVLSGVQLMRKSGTSYTPVPIDLKAIRKGSAPDPVLHADDVIVVPFSYLKNFLLNGTAIAASVSSAIIYNH
jgi:polysaccharide export outer membrane protein